MRIERIELREIRMKLRHPFEISSGVTEDRRILLLKLHADGAVGWGECVASEAPTYAYETTDTAWHVLTEFILPRVVGGDLSVDDPEGVLAPVAWVRGHRMARAAVEMAAWDLSARVSGTSLSARLGGTRARVPVGVSVGLQASDDALLERVAEYVDDGYARVKLKIKPGRDVEMLSAVRDRFPELPILADANSAYVLGSGGGAQGSGAQADLSDAGRLRALDDLDLMMIEQPLAYDDFLHHARLQRMLRTPVCLDESITSEGDLELALELGSCRIVNIKPGRVGGLGVSRRIHDTMRARGLDVWCGGMLESGVGRAHNLALASLPGFTLPGDISASRRYWDRDIVWPEFEVDADGHMQVPQGTGMGVEVDEERVAALTVREVEFRA